MLNKKHAAAFLAEFFGVGILTMLFLTVQRSTIGVPFFISIAVGLVIIVLMFAFINVSGAHFNPALTIALWTARKVSTLRAVFYIVAQLLGGWAAYYLFTYLTGAKFAPIGGHYTAKILLSETFGAFVLGFIWSSAMFQKLSTAVRASVGGVAFLLGVLAASVAAIGIVNPAVALGIRSWVWGTYVLGPVLGAVIGVNLYGLLFAPSKTDKDQDDSSSKSSSLKASKVDQKNDQDDDEDKEESLSKTSKATTSSAKKKSVKKTASKKKSTAKRKTK